MIERQMQPEKQRMRSGYFNRDAFRQKTRSILVLQTAIAGVRHCVREDEKGGKELLDTLTPGTELHLFREPENAVDPWAILVCTANGQKLGYVPHFKNEAIARLMDCGKVFRAYIDEPPPAGPNDDAHTRRTRTGTEDERFPFSVYLEE
jgi:hypothetical protein